MHKADLLCIAHRGTAGLGVFNNIERHGGIGGFIHIDVADAGTGLDARNLGVFGDGTDQPCPAPGNQQIDIAYSLHKLFCALTAGVLYQIDERFGKPGGI